MSAELLREAAALMRERAEAAAPGPWEVLWNAVAFIDTVADPSDPTGQTPMQEPVKVADANPVDRAHIASWHPAIALAVAAWLDRVAGPVGVAQGNGLSGEAYDLPEALAVARAYLGRDV